MALHVCFRTKIDGSLVGYFPRDGRGDASAWCFRIRQQMLLQGFAAGVFFVACDCDNGPIDARQTAI